MTLLELIAEAIKVANRRISALEARVTKLEEEAETKRTVQNGGASVVEYDHSDPWEGQG